MNTDARSKLARQMGLDPAEYENVRTQRAGAGAVGSMSLGAGKDTGSGAGPDRGSGPALAAIDRLCKAMNISPAAFAEWRAGQLQLAIERQSRGEPLTSTQEALLGAPAAPSTPTPTTRPAPTAAHGVMTLGAALAAVKAAAEREGRIGAARLSVPLRLG